jgi:hypothetical protein
MTKIYNQTFKELLKEYRLSFHKRRDGEEVISIDEKDDHIGQF